MYIKKHEDLPTVLDAQQRVNETASRLIELRRMHVWTPSMREQRDDAEDWARRDKIRTERERDEVVDRHTGRKVRLRTKFRLKSERCFLSERSSYYFKPAFLRAIKSS